MMIDANDIGRARDTNIAEITEAGGVPHWYIREGFVIEDLNSVVGDAVQSLTDLAINERIDLIELFSTAFSSGLAVGWTLHRDHDDA